MGSTPLRLQPAPGNSFGSVTVAPDNAGTIASTAGGPAIVAEGANCSSLSTTNRQSGTIGAIQATVGSFDNSGTIDGGALSVVTFGGQNRGTIRNVAVLDGLWHADTLVSAIMFGVKSVVMVTALLRANSPTRSSMVFRLLTVAFLAMDVAQGALKSEWSGWSFG